MSSCARTRSASAPISAATSSTTVEMAPTRSPAPTVGGQVGGRGGPRVNAGEATTAEVLTPRPTPDHKSYDCMTNTTMCGDEAQCIQSRSTTYCTCRRGFQKVPDKNSCQGTSCCCWRGLGVRLSRLQLVFASKMCLQACGMAGAPEMVSLGHKRGERGEAECPSPGWRRPAPSEGTPSRPPC